MTFFINFLGEVTLEEYSSIYSIRPRIKRQHFNVDFMGSVNTIHTECVMDHFRDNQMIM